jgi:hypothetical protein
MVFAFSSNFFEALLTLSIKLPVMTQQSFFSKSDDDVESFIINRYNPTGLRNNGTY